MGIGSTWSNRRVVWPKFRQLATVELFTVWSRLTWPTSPLHGKGFPNFQHTSPCQLVYFNLSHGKSTAHMIKVCLLRCLGLEKLWVTLVSPDVKVAEISRDPKHVWGGGTNCTSPSLGKTSSQNLSEISGRTTFSRTLVSWPRERFRVSPAWERNDTFLGGVSFNIIIYR